MRFVVTLVPAALLLGVILQAFAVNGPRAAQPRWGLMRRNTFAHNAIVTNQDTGEVNIF
jgi:hypothetical protein